MRKNRALLYVSCLLTTLAGCAGQGSSPVELVDEGADADAGLVEEGGDPTPEGLPPFVFEARPHTPRSRPVWNPPPSLASLPPMQTSSRCWSPGRAGIDDVAVARGSGGTTRPRPKPKPKPAPVMRKPVSPSKNTLDEGGGPIGGSSGVGRGYGGAAPGDAGANKRSKDDRKSREPASRPAPPPTADAPTGGDWTAEAEAAPDPVATPPSRPRDSRKAERQRRKEQRGPSSAGAATPAAEPSSAPLEDEDRADFERSPVAPLMVATESSEMPPAREGWGEATFLSNDDSMSLSSAQRLIYAIENYLPLPAEHVRPHELLNYFSFDTAPVADGWDFSVHGELAAEPGEDGLHTLALAVDSHPVTRETRRNVNLTLVVDRSGSMRAEGRMEYLKRGLLNMVRELKAGDVVSIVSFDHQLCAPIKHFVVGRDDPSALTKAIHGLKPRGNTNLNAGLEEGYRVTDQAYRDDYSNRVLLITDALANTGVTDATTMSMVTDYFDARRIRLSGVGVGREFNDQLLDRLTEKGRGAYVFLGSEAEVDAVFGSRFISLVETVANDVHFRLHLPPTLRLQRFFGEQASARREEVQAIHYFANTSQLFLSEVEPWQGDLRPEDTIMLEVDYEHAESGQAMVEEFVIPIGELLRSDRNVRKGALVMDWVDGMRSLAYLATPSGWRPQPAGWADPYGAQICGDGRQALHSEASTLSGDPEVRNLLRLWDVACARYGEPRRPTRRNESGWPGAGGR